MDGSRRHAYSYDLRRLRSEVDSIKHSLSLLDEADNSAQMSIETPPVTDRSRAKQYVSDELSRLLRTTYLAKKMSPPSSSPPQSTLSQIEGSEESNSPGSAQASRWHQNYNASVKLHKMIHDMKEEKLEEAKNRRRSSLDELKSFHKAQVHS